MRKMAGGKNKNWRNIHPASGLVVKKENANIKILILIMENAQIQASFS